MQLFQCKHGHNPTEFKMCPYCFERCEPVKEESKPVKKAPEAKKEE